MSATVSIYETINNHLPGVRHQEDRFAKAKERVKNPCGREEILRISKTSSPPVISVPIVKDHLNAVNHNDYD